MVYLIHCDYSHNLQHYLDFFAQIRRAIYEERFDEFSITFLAQYQSVDWYKFFQAELTSVKQRPGSPLQ